MMEYQTTLATNEPVAVTIGNFDGIHLGHQYLLQELRMQAEALQSKAVMITFLPHTLAVVRPDIQFQLLTTLEEKLALAHQYGQIADSIVIHFTPEVAAMTAEHFMNDLRQRFSLRGMVVGADFSLGHHRMGDMAFLAQYGREHQIHVHTVTLEEAEQGRISSTRIRTLVSAGHIAEANALLGHPLIISGPVSHGDKRGRLLGFPTANIQPDAQKLLPVNGVYAARVTIQMGSESDPEGDSPVYNGVVNIGVRPTFNGKERLVEVHLLDVTLDLYDKHITVELLAYLRGEQRFAGVEALKTQIASDVQRAKQIFTIRRVSN